MTKNYEEAKPMKRNMFGYLLLIVLSILLFALPLAAAPEKNQGLIQIAILLDTSNSMDGLIDQARTQIWQIVNELAQAKKNGKSPKLEVALFEYGNNNIPEREGYIRQVQPFTSDLDKISEELFKLVTNGGDEYCGQVIGTALRELKWNSGKDDYKMIVIAGNEPFTQGTVDFKTTCKNAVGKGIIVNTIFCGSFQEGVETQWKAGADLSDGTYVSIDQNQKIPDIKAPQDVEILKLGQALNKTYVPYGTEGKLSQNRQSAEDVKAESSSLGAGVQRTVAKSSELYVNTTWDLVDAVKTNGFKILDNLKTKELPPEMQKMSKAEQKKYIESKIKERETIQTRIALLNKERQAYVDKEMQKLTKTNSLGTAIIQAIRKQAAEKNFKFKAYRS
jgi:hypothetical protein